MFARFTAKKDTHETAHVGFSGNNYLKTVMDTVLDGLVIINKQGIIQNFNPAAQRIFGYSPEEVVGKNINMLMPEPYHGEHDGYLHNYLSTGDKKVIGIGREVSGKRKDGDIFPMELGVNEMDIDGIKMFVGTIRDISERKIAESNLKEEAARILAVMNTVLDGLITIDDKGIIQTFNPASVKIFGYKPEEVIGKNVNILMPEPYHTEHDGYLHNYLSTGDKKVIGIGREVSGKRKDGDIFPMELGVNEMNVVGKRMFVGTVRDISQRKQSEIDLRKSEERYDLAVKCLSVGVWDWDVQTNALYWSDRYKEIISSEQDVEERYEEWESRLHPDDKEKTVNMLMNHVAGKGPYSAEYRLCRIDGSYVWIYATGQAVWDKNGKAIRMVGSIEDITTRKKSEQEILQYMEALKRSNQELDDFAYIASHDLKEPLRGLSNNAVFLKEDFGDKIGEDGNKRLLRMSYLCERMERLVNDLLYFSRLGRQELAVQKTNLNEVINDITSMIETSLKQANAKIQIIGTLPTIICDLPRITEVFRNLITNALKYNDKPIKIIEIGCEYKNKERLFFVRDNGIGIAAEFYNDVFRIFKRLNDEDDSVKGTGVGLTFVKKIIERHNGRIWIESEVGKGSYFYFTINEINKTKED